MKKKEQPEMAESQLREVMSMLGKRSAEARKNKLGKRAFAKQMKEMGKLGGRPKKADTDGKGKA